MTDAPLIAGLEGETLELAHRRAIGAGEMLIYICRDTGSGASFADDLRQLARYFEIAGIRVVEDGVGVVGQPRAQPTTVAESDITRLLEQAVRAVRAAQLAALHQLHNAEAALRRRTIDVLEADRRNTDTIVGKEALERKLRLAQQQTEKVKGTLSFRLGHALIHKTRSVGGVIELPKVLWSLRQDASSRRIGEETETGLRRIVQRIARFRDRGNVIAKPSVQTTRPKVVPAKRFLPPFEIATGADLKKLRVAGIFDEFTVHSFAPECELISLHAATWQAQLAEHPPHLLFVESAWQGAGGSWDRKINHCARELRELVQHCQEREIPTAFWNKEDPIHFGTFLNTASLFDAVFTTDFDCIHRYRELLGHERVYVLPFACQPRQHNPIEKFERKNAACFAGAYYARYPERQRDFLRILLKLLERGPVEIFDRNHGKVDADYQFPASYRDYIVGNLPFSEIERAYKGYRYAININSIKTSQTMFARRVFELLASNTLTISNYAKGIRVLFGDLVVATDDPEELGAALAQLDDVETSRLRRLAGLRKALAEHTYQNRLAYIATKLFDSIASPRLTPTITVVGAASTDYERTALATAFARQSYPHKQLVVVTPGSDPDVAAIDGEYVARFADGDHYGDHYLQDLALATLYHDGPVIGMGPPPARFRTEQRVSTAAAIVRRDELRTTSLADFARDERTLDHALVIDDFQYTHPGGEPGLNTGVSFSAVLAHADRVEVALADLDIRVLGPADFVPLFADGIRSELSVSHGPDGITIDSELDADGRQYLYQRGESPLSTFGFESTVRFHLEVTAGLRLQAVFLFLDQEKNRVGDVIRIASMNHEAELPTKAAYVRFGILVVGPGTARVRRLVLGHVSTEEPTRIIGRSRVLVVSNGYPSPEALYRNGFVHRRVLDYRRAGVEVDVYCHRPRERISYHTFEGTDVVSGRAEVLKRMLDSNAYDTVLVHFLDEEMWRELMPRLDRLHVYVWIHGAEVQPWHRRSFNYTTAEEVESAKTSSGLRIDLWTRVLGMKSPNLHLITVSRTLANEIEEDYGVTLAPAQHSVIHNVIDTTLFRYEPKPAAQRTKILSIRPFATRTYANDLTVAAILELAKRPWFGELDFHIIGDGALFEATLAPVQGLRNVLVERRFVRQEEIAALHRRNGIFLCPTRMDSQGVSRDEAMASGLVPVTTRIAAVPEFVDEDCAFLATPENATELASALETLYKDPARFQRMSAAAAARVRKDRSADQTSLRELALFTRRS